MRILATMILLGCIGLGCVSEKMGEQEQHLAVQPPRDELYELRETLLKDYDVAMQAKRSPVVKVLTWNLSEVSVGNVATFERMIEFIKKEEPDFVSLQGITQEQIQRLYDEFDAQYYYGRTIEKNGIEYGNVLFTRYPIEQAIDNRLKSPGLAEPRTILDVNVRVKEILPLKLVTAAFDTLKPEINSDTVKHAYQFIDPKAGIMFGDFNAEVSERVLKDLGRHWSVLSFDGLPDYEKTGTNLYHILVRPAANWRVISARKLKEFGREEIPLLVEIKYLSDDE